MAAPTIANPTSSNVQTTFATLGANVSADGGEAITERGIVWGTSANPDTGDNKEAVTGTTGVFTTNVTGLPSQTTVHFRGFATNASGTSYTANTQIVTLQRTAGATWNRIFHS